MDSTLELVIRMVASLMVIGTVVLLAQRLTRSRLGARMQRSGLDIVARRQLTKSSSVVLVRAGNRHVLLGVSDERVAMLTEGDDLVFDDDLDDAAVAESIDLTGEAAAGLTVDELLGVSPNTPERSADPQPTSGARMLHGRTSSATTRMSVIDALRDLTVRKT